MNPSCALCDQRVGAVVFCVAATTMRNRSINNSGFRRICKGCRAPLELNAAGQYIVPQLFADAKETS